MPTLLRDIRYGGRTLRKHLGLSIVAVLALTLGIGLTTTMFSIVYSVMMKGLPYRDAKRIVVVYEQNLSRGWQRSSPSIHDFVDFKAGQRSFEHFAAHYSGTVNVSGTEKAERYRGSWVTANMFDIAGVRPILGRTIRPGEDAPGGDRVVVIGYSVWKNRYAGDPAVIGQTIRVNGMPFTVIGVMPEKYGFPDDGALWLPLQVDPLSVKRGEGQHVSIVGKLRPGISMDAARADVNAMALRLAKEYKHTNDGVTATVLGFIDADLGPEPRQLLLTMLGAVFLVLLIACANVANLLLDRAAHRTKEVGIRTALGASRGAVVRQFLSETMVLALTGGVLAVLLSYVGVAIFNRAITSTEPPFWLDIQVHPPVLFFALVVALLATVVSGAIPAYQSSRADISEILKDESRGASSFRIGRLSRALVVFEIALSCGLLVAAGLMIKSVARLRTLDTGFTVRNVFTSRLGFPSSYADTTQQIQFFERLQERLAALPGVQAVSLSSSLPGVDPNGGSFAIEGKSYTRDSDYPNTRSTNVTPGYFSTFEFRALQGRLLTQQDRRETLPVAVVNQAFAAKFFSGGDPVGRRIRMGGAQSTAPWRTIVGVVPTSFNADPDEPRPAMVYMPLAQNHTNFVSIALRAANNPMALTAQVRDVVASLNPDIAIYWTYSMQEALSRPTWFVRVFGTMFMIFGFIALFLASVGLYAVMSFSVSRRTREVGIRMALGAHALQVVRMIFRQGLLQLALGMTLGLALALGVSQLLRVLLFEVQPRDPLVYLSVAGALTAVGLLACLIPAARATRVDPLVALRAE
jgi:putative ABC transport system permease protein